MGWASVILFAITGNTAPDASPPKSMCELEPIKIIAPESTDLPAIDGWQIQWGDMLLSDMHLATLADDKPTIKAIQERASERGLWIYLGVGAAAVGTAVSSTGWALFGQKAVSRTLSLTMGIGGVLLGMAGLLTVTETVQASIDPYAAPARLHIVDRDQGEQLAARANQRVLEEICAGGKQAAPQ